MIMCFTGYRASKMPFSQADTEKVNALKAWIERLLEMSSSRVERCYCGMCDGADLWAALAVLKNRERLGMELYCVVPFKNHRDRIPVRYRADYDYVLQNADNVVLLNDDVLTDSYDVAFQARNRYMVEHSGIVVAICNAHNIQKGGTLSTVNLAKKYKKYLLYLDPLTGVILKEKYEQL